MTVRALRRVFKVVHGGTPTSEPENWDGGIAWATPIDLGRLNGSRIGETQRTITTAGLRTGSSLVPSGSLIVSTRAPIGYVAETTTPMAFNQGCRGLVPRAELDVRFFRYQLVVSAERLQSLGQGSTFLELSTDGLASFPLAVPPLSNQRAVADYLDAQTAQIEVLLQDAERLRQLALERVWTRFCETVTSTTAPEVPLRRVLLSISDGPFGSAFTSTDYSVDGAFVVRLGNIGMAEFDPEPEARIPMTLYASFLRHEVRPGDLLIAGLGDEGRHAGRACVAPDLGPAMVKGKCFCARVDERLADPRYLALYLSSSLGAQEVAVVSHGSGRVMINLEIAKALPVILPVRSLQTEIVELIAAEQARADRAEALLDRQIALLSERRQALIEAAVTGQFEIPGVAA